MDTSLQRLAAISNHLMSSLADIVNCPSAAAKQGAFKCFASLGANDEDIRKRIIETHGLMVHVVNGMNNPEPTVSFERDVISNICCAALLAHTRDSSVTFVYVHKNIKDFLRKPSPSHR